MSEIKRVNYETMKALAEAYYELNNGNDVEQMALDDAAAVAYCEYITTIGR